MEKFFEYPQHMFQVAQSVVRSPTADPGVAKSIQARSHTFMEIRK